MVKPLISMQKVVRASNIVVLDVMNPHIRSTRDGTVIKLDVNNGVCTMDMWICLDETGPVFSWQGLGVAKTLSTSLEDWQECVEVENQTLVCLKKLKEQNCMESNKKKTVRRSRRRS